MSDDHLDRMCRELKIIRELLVQVLNKVIEAESEIPERMRRFISYMHDIHDVSYMYEERGHNVPSWILREMERCDDRYRQIVKELHLDGNAFDKVRREMAGDPENRWDHTKLLSPKETEHETGNSKLRPSSGSEGGAKSS